MSRWSWFFLLVPVLGVAVFAVAPAVGWSLPENISTFGREIDRLYWIIFATCSVVFLGTQLMLFYILFRFGKKQNGEGALYTHGSRRLEIAWTIAPALVLLYISLVQMPAWIQIRYPQNQPDIPLNARVIGRQFEWRIVYPGPDGQIDTYDDVHVPNELHVAKDEMSLVELRTMDVQHSFFLPHLRLKQDLVPGLAIPVWFEATRSTRDFQASRALLHRASFPGDGIGRLAHRLAKPSTPLDELLRSKLSDPSVSFVGAYSGPDIEWPKSIDESGLASLQADLNGVLETTDLTDPAFWRERGVEGIADTGSASSVFTQVAGDETPTAELEAELAREPSDEYRPLRNRFFLSAAYSGSFAPVPHFEIVCAELCGWGHYKMRGRLVVHESREELDAWLEQQHAEQEVSQ